MQTCGDFLLAIERFYHLVMNNLKALFVKTSIKNKQKALLIREAFYLQKNFNLIL